MSELTVIPMDTPIVPEAIDGDFCYTQGHNCVECPARFRCPDAFTFPGPGLCNLIALLEDLSGTLTDASTKAESAQLICKLTQSLETVKHIEYCVKALE